MGFTRNTVAILLLLIIFIVVPKQSIGQSTKPGVKSGIYLSLYKEQYQNAFYMLIPNGWKTKGGMVPSGMQ